MFIVWGTKSRQEEGGIIGDWCDVCRAPKFHRLIHFYKVNHIYYIPLGRGTYSGTNRQCRQCSTTCSCNMTTYPRAMTDQEAFGRSIEEVLAATNPFLLEQIQKVRSLEYQITQRMPQPAYDVLPSAPHSGQTDQRMLAALKTLGTLDARDQDVIGFMDRLQRWDSLTQSEREVLPQEIDAFATEDHKVKAAFHFMRTLSRPTPSGFTCLGCFGGLVIFIVVFATLPFLQSWLWGPLFFVASIALWCFVFTKTEAGLARRWVRKVLIPRSGQYDVDMRYFVGLLSSLKGNMRYYDEKIADMTHKVAIISDELHKQGYLKQEESPSVLPPK